MSVSDHEKRGILKTRIQYLNDIAQNTIGYCEENIHAQIKVINDQITQFDQIIRLKNKINSLEIEAIRVRSGLLDGYGRNYKDILEEMVIEEEKLLKLLNSGENTKAIRL